MSGESSYTEFSEINPTEGAVAKMFKGEIVTEKISVSTPKQEEVKNPLVSKEQIIFDYYRAITNKINQFASLNSPGGKKGEVSLNFSVSYDGNLIEESKVLSASDSSLIPFAIKAIKDSSPFPVFPESLKKTKEIFYITLEYK